MKPVLGQTCIDPILVTLGTGYSRFESPTGIDGLAKEERDGEALHILAVVTVFQGRGSFRNFITEAK